MLQWVKEFNQQFILQVPSNKQKAPPENFFSPQALPKYATFLEKTINMAKSAICVAELSHEDIQRSPFNTQFFRQ